MTVTRHHHPVGPVQAVTRSGVSQGWGQIRVLLRGHFRVLRPIGTLLLAKCARKARVHRIDGLTDDTGLALALG
jgi:hypothetical protein